MHIKDMHILGSLHQNISHDMVLSHDRVCNSLWKAKWSPSDFG